MKEFAGEEKNINIGDKVHYSVLSLIIADFISKAEWIYGSASFKNILKTICADGSFAMIMYRFMQASYKIHLIPVALLFNKILSGFCHCVIGMGADFGPRFILIHSIGVVINSSVVGGSGIMIEHQVTIGAEKRKSPVLGNNIFIGAGAKIIGRVKIGDNVKIGANSVVLDDVPDNATVVGIPAKIKKMG